MANDHLASKIETAPATWAAVEELFGTKGEPSRCWCRWFALTAKDWATTDAQVDSAQRTKATASDLFHGTLSLFTAAGFRPVTQSVPGRPVVRLIKEGRSATAASGSSGRQP